MHFWWMVSVGIWAWVCYHCQDPWPSYLSLMTDPCLSYFKPLNPLCMCDYVFMQRLYVSSFYCLERTSMQVAAHELMTKTILENTCWWTNYSSETWLGGVQVPNRRHLGTLPYNFFPFGLFLPKRAQRHFRWKKVHRGTRSCHMVEQNMQTCLQVG
jgi:hypothetical protein